MKKQSSGFREKSWQSSAILFLAAIFFMVPSGCEKNGPSSKDQSENQSPAFRLLKKEQTGLNFENVIKQDLEFNVFNYMYFFNGGGIGAGDFNNDGLVDLFFTSNMGPNKLFLNKGGLKFEDVTALAGMEGLNGWTTGVSVVDINNDGLLDIYVSQVGDYKTIKGKNQLWVCQGIENGIPVFKDEAESYGLDFIGFSTQASFFDYDQDGDLDMFLLNHSLHANGTFGKRDVFKGTYHPESGDKLFRNDKGKFTNVTETSGIISTVIGYGLGVVTGDINNDGWPDIYIGNDFHENDYLYINQQDGTFKESLTEMIQHTSRFSMGVDMADINNDGNNDIISLDMMPEDPVILKSSLGEDDYGVFHFKLGYGYNYQFARNNLQINNGDKTFSEVGIYAGVHATDWSWSPLFVDYDNDGYKDLFISNGIPRRMNDIDYVNYRKSNDDFRWKTQLDNTEKNDLAIVEKMPQIKLGNKFFKNTGHLQFEDESKRVENDLPSFSNGCVSIDLDNDGDLDMVVNNLEDEPFLYENLLSEKNANKGAYLSIAFNGPAQNRNGIGSTVVLFYKDGSILKNEFYPVRGYQSSALTPLHVGVGAEANID
ncbi:MAG: CRTAC1 family protein, partial [Saprospiraceae bacterium]|nr:CRTAC1 family protein [Saprospiraceae bacterium]